MSTINELIDASVECLKCGTKGYMKCNCWTRCSCGWTAEKGKPCSNPNTTRCSTKLQFGPKPPRRKKGAA